jgi:hypothetical protein
VQDLHRERPAVADLEREQVSVDRDHEPDLFERRDLRMRALSSCSRHPLELLQLLKDASRLSGTLRMSRGGTPFIGRSCRPGAVSPSTPNGAWRSQNSRTVISEKRDEPLPFANFEVGCPPESSKLFSKVGGAARI